MIKSELVERISSQNPHLYHNQAEKLVTTILDEIVSAIARGDRVELRGFGVFTPKVRTPRLGRNPKTGTDVPVPKKIVPYFKAGKEIRQRLNLTSEESAAEAAGH
jgi:integration host factor subunit beta